MPKMIQNEVGSFHNFLSEGCKLCKLGAKMVLFVTGICGRNCFYCPISEDRKNDVVYANERYVTSDEDVIAEAYQMDALGTGITGGEPLLKLMRVLHYIRLLKSEFGAEHHIHLYTAIAPDRETLVALADAGLDEIRFHPPQEMWDSLKHTLFADSIKTAIELGMSAGIEIPSIEGAEGVLPFLDKAGGFLNLNELEFSDTNADAMRIRGFELVNDISNAVANSRACAEKLDAHSSKIHFCSSRYKDAVQLKKRLLRIANKTARVFDGITDDGTIVVGVIESGELDAVIGILHEMEVPDDMFEVRGGRIEIAWWILEDIAQDLKRVGRTLLIIERYPFEGGLVVETMPI
ncbi:MAG TPA: radical SAM protein [Methanosarcinaceae archaeon]|nr:radical SAM protein [Methanosarcinaceae archaeon]